jgi:hypothetical protein
MLAKSFDRESAAVDIYACPMFSCFSRVTITLRAEDISIFPVLFLPTKLVNTTVRFLRRWASVGLKKLFSSY